MTTNGSGFMGWHWQFSIVFNMNEFFIYLISLTGLNLFNCMVKDPSEELESPVQRVSGWGNALSRDQPGWNMGHLYLGSTACISAGVWILLLLLVWLLVLFLTNWQLLVFIIAVCFTLITSNDTKLALKLSTSFSSLTPLFLEQTA